MFISTTDVLGMNLLKALLFTPCNNFKIADHHCIGAFGNWNHIAHMITMSVANENEIRLDNLWSDRSSRVFTKERINHELISICFEFGCSMSVPGEFCGHKNLLFIQYRRNQSEVNSFGHRSCQAQWNSAEILHNNTVCWQLRQKNL